MDRFFSPGKTTREKQHEASRNIFHYQANEPHSIIIPCQPASKSCAFFPPRAQKENLNSLKIRTLIDSPIQTKMLSAKKELSGENFPTTTTSIRSSFVSRRKFSTLKKHFLLQPTNSSVQLLLRAPCSIFNQSVTFHLSAASVVRFTPNEMGSRSALTCTVGWIEVGIFSIF